MPTVKKRTNTNRKTKSKKAVSDKQKSIRQEIILWIILGGSILMFISNFGLGGKIGGFISNLLFGLFGIMAYLLPILLFLCSAFAMANKKNKIMYIKLIAGILLFILFCALGQLLSGKQSTGIKIIDYYKISQAQKKGGGILGGLTLELLVPALGLAGTYVLTTVLSIISIVIITEKSIFKGVKKGGTKVYETAKSDAVKRKEKAAIRAEKRMNKKVAGVAMNTRIYKKEDPGDNIHEITPQSSEMEEYLFDNAFVQEAENASFIPHKEEQKERKKRAPVKKSDTSSESVADMVIPNEDEENKDYIAPPLSLLKKSENRESSGSEKNLRETAIKLQKTLQDFGVGVTITNVSKGPAVTRYELSPEQGVKVSKIVSLADDIKLNLAAADIRIEAPIPGKSAVGIEVPNKENSTVVLRELLESEEFLKHPSKLAFAVGKDIGGKVVVADIARMPHLLIAGATGSGKSVCINTLIMSILYKANQEEVKLIMIDPKVVELSVYNGIPHLFIPVVTDPKKAAGALNWAVVEMTDRYKKFADLNVRDLKGYNEKIESVEAISDDEKPKKLPQIVIIVDELADLMMVAPGEVEDSICRLAQLARAAGLHLIVATQRPSVNVITGLIKANMPSRIAFSVSSGVDSRTIIDMNGAEKLLGKGDMLFYPSGYQKPARVQGAFISDSEVGDVVAFLSKQTKEVVFNTEIEEKINNMPVSSENNDTYQDRDSYFVEAGKFIIEKDKASIGMLQRMFKIGFNRAARIMDQLFDAGVVGDEEGTKPRKVLMTMEEFEEYIDEYI